MEVAVLQQLEQVFFKTRIKPKGGHWNPTGAAHGCPGINTTLHLGDTVTTRKKLIAREIGWLLLMEKLTKLRPFTLPT